MLEDYLVLCLAAALGGAVNSIAGGGTLLTFPALFAALGSSGDAAVIANATSTVALAPASLAALFGYRREIRHERYWALALLGPSLVGGLIGSVMVVALPSDSFKSAVPWLILTAGLLFALQPYISRWLGIGKSDGGPPTRGMLIGAIVFQFFVGIYGGYFGAGIGILMLASLGFLGFGDLHAMNAAKNILAAVINCVAALWFIASGLIDWPRAGVMTLGALCGYYLGAHFSQRVPQAWVRRAIAFIGLAIAAVQFWRQFIRGGS
jgi:hypothetical protein